MLGDAKAGAAWTFTTCLTKSSPHRRFRREEKFIRGMLTAVFDDDEQDFACKTDLAVTLVPLLCTLASSFFS
jgi:hypothetical protein